jgi:hypothetical protein
MARVSHATHVDLPFGNLARKVEHLQIGRRACNFARKCFDLI